MKSNPKNMNKIKPTKALFIRLGQGSNFAKECVIEKNTLKLDYREIDHNLCSAGKWEEVREQIIQKYNCTKGVATRSAQQIKYFYEEEKNTLWITFYNNLLYWCFLDKKVTLEKDGTKYRKVIDGWNNKNIDGKTLFLENFNGRFLQINGYMGAICRVSEFSYLVNKINNEQKKETTEAQRAFNSLKEKITPLIKDLKPKEFELFIDLIFRNAGWHRTGKIGGTQNLIDLAIIHPITGERAVVQIKCKSQLSEYKKYEQQFLEMTEYDKFFYIVHSPESDLEKYNNEIENINIYFADKIAEMAINAGLYDWLLTITN